MGELTITKRKTESKETRQGNHEEEVGALSYNDDESYSKTHRNHAQVLNEVHLKVNVTIKIF